MSKERIVFKAQKPKPKSSAKKNNHPRICLLPRTEITMLKEIKALDEKFEQRIDPFIELKNGETHQKRLSEAVKDSWERINHVQEKLEKIDSRTVVLDDISIMVESYKTFKSKSKRFLLPVFKAISVTVIIGYLIYFFMKKGFTVSSFFEAIGKLL